MHHYKRYQQLQLQRRSRYNTDDGGDEKTGSQSQPLTLSTLKTTQADTDTSSTLNVNSNIDDNSNTEYQ